MYQATNAQVLTEVEEGAARRRRNSDLRDLVAQLDSLVEACEEAHLSHLHKVGPELASRADGVFASARSVLDRPELGRVDTAERLRIVDLMDVAWSVEEAAFDRLVPERTRLPEDVGEEGWSSAA